LSTFADYSAAPYDVRIVQGDDFIEPITLEDGESEAINLSGYTFKSQLRRSADNGLVAEFSISVSGNVVTRSLTSAVTTDLDGVYVHDFQWRNPQGRIRTLLAGQFEVVPEVTR